MRDSPQLLRWAAVVAVAAVAAAVLAYVAGGLAVVLGDWRWAARLAFLAAPLVLALVLWPASRLAPQVTRGARLWAAVAGLALTWLLLAIVMAQGGAAMRAEGAGPSVATKALDATK